MDSDLFEDNYNTQHIETTEDKKRKNPSPEESEPQYHFIGKSEISKIGLILILIVLRTILLQERLFFFKRLDLEFIIGQTYNDWFTFHVQFGCA